MNTGLFTFTALFDASGAVAEGEGGWVADTAAIEKDALFCDQLQNVREG